MCVQATEADLTKLKHLGAWDHECEKVGLELMDAKETVKKAESDLFSRMLSWYTSVWLIITACVFPHYHFQGIHWQPETCANIEREYCILLGVARRWNVTLYRVLLSRIQDLAYSKNAFLCSTKSSRTMDIPLSIRDIWRAVLHDFIRTGSLLGSMYIWRRHIWDFACLKLWSHPYFLFLADIFLNLSCTEERNCGLYCKSLPVPQSLLHRSAGTSSRPTCRSPSIWVHSCQDLEWAMPLTSW